MNLHKISIQVKPNAKRNEILDWHYQGKIK